MTRIYHGEIGPFRKFETFAHQTEWRIALIDTAASDIEQQSYVLDVGNISD
ncbi:hypothetical protein [Paraburkholderia phenoliruptrix]|uniref:hypothetical protein n=1 Tax=Paraburkholderia phenoliruptrix TaxID=252970 RepID=UPI001427B1BF|nr:hypothetical protein [Paraburkholderia phenoliruptrix]